MPAPRRGGTRPRAAAWFAWSAQRHRAEDNENRYRPRDVGENRSRTGCSRPRSRAAARARPPGGRSVVAAFYPVAWAARADRRPDRARAQPDARRAPSRTTSSSRRRKWRRSRARSSSSTSRTTSSRRSPTRCAMRAARRSTCCRGRRSPRASATSPARPTRTSGSIRFGSHASSSGWVWCSAGRPEGAHSPRGSGARR